MKDGAGALILSCAGMSDIKELLERELKVPVIAGVISALKIAEQFANVFALAIEDDKRKVLYGRFSCQAWFNGNA